jgi:hypothetical protein
MPDEEILLSIYVSVNCIVHALTPTITGLLESMEGEYFQVWSFNPRCLTKKTAPTSPSGQCPVTTNPSPPRSLLAFILSPYLTHACELSKKEALRPGTLRHKHRHGPRQRLVRGAIIR